MKAHEHEKILLQIRAYHESMRRHLPFLQNGKRSDIFFSRLEELIRAFKIPLSDPTRDAKALFELFIEYHVPFTVLTEDLDIVKDEWILQSDATRKEQIRTFFKVLSNEIGQLFLLHDAQSFVPVDMGRVTNKPLYRIHHQWQQNLFNAVKKVSFEDFPLHTARTCPFTEALKFPESRMICGELNICEIMENTHEILHELAFTFLFLWRKKHYKAAYILFQEIKEKNERLLNLIATLYFNAQINHNQVFKKFLKEQLTYPEEVVVAIFDITSMREINKYYNVKTGDLVINLVAEILEAIYDRYRYTMLFTQGSSGDFYLFFQTKEKRLLYDFQTLFDDRLKQRVKEEKNLPKFNVKKAFLHLCTPLQLNLEEVSSLYSYLKDQLTHTNYIQIETTAQQKEALQWVAQHYQYLIKLKQKMEEGSVEIFLQPINYLQNIDKIHAYEVLARIQENGQYIAAGAFIDDLVKMGMVSQLDHLVLERVIHHAQSLHRLGGKYFLNISPQTLKDESYVKKLIEAIEGPLAGTEIIVELTEQVFLENISLVTFLHESYQLIFAIDDFGTGYSSLNTVIKLAELGAVGYLKIDGSLTSQFESSKSTRTIMQFIRDMSQSLRLETIVECIETKEQARQLSEFKIEYGQGYYLGRPQNILEMF